ncbi:hypothetical protein BKA67DRAFT_660046 [Truncatella angustata]|uniref:Uncharacterized protein n=1 Tax=Truncatella angustata TaxID=152316 RepID=A0A9P8UJ85_9PEZI|nr:uncharacterized protein BKA67DRAFT_660046 [Truncatella angustata]KAH6653423.1 hypothetical protein BKA67DRAFT_660046 [Truncatella angustata]
MDEGLLQSVYWIDFSRTEDDCMTAVDQTTCLEGSDSMVEIEGDASPYLPWRDDQTPEDFFDIEAYSFDMQSESSEHVQGHTYCQSLSSTNTEDVQKEGMHHSSPMLERDSTEFGDVLDMNDIMASSSKSSDDHMAEFTSCLSPGTGSNFVGNDFCVDCSQGCSNYDGNGELQRSKNIVTPTKRGTDNVTDETLSENDRPKRRKTTFENKPKNKTKNWAWNKVYIHLEMIEFMVDGSQEHFHWKTRSRRWSSGNGALRTLEDLGSYVLARLPWVSVWVRPRGDGFPVQVFWDENEHNYVGRNGMCRKSLRISYAEMARLLMCPHESFFISES